MERAEKENEARNQVEAAGKNESYKTIDGSHRIFTTKSANESGERRMAAPPLAGNWVSIRGGVEKEITSRGRSTRPKTQGQIDAHSGTKQFPRK